MPQASNGALPKGTIGYVLAHEQFTMPTLQEIGAAAVQSGFGLLAASDHFQPWQANEGHSGEAWVTLGALAARTANAWIGTTVTCPTLRYHPAVVAEAFASLSALYPGRIFLGVGSGGALNEQAATGAWPDWSERWERLIEAIAVIRALWTGKEVKHRGKYYTVDGKLYDPPAQPIPILTAANGRKAMRLAGKHGDGLITDPMTWQQFKREWEAGARAAGKDPEDMPVMVEQLVTVGDDGTARESAELWRFLPRAFKAYHNVCDPVEIQRRAQAEQPIEKVVGEWCNGTNPQTHIESIDRLFQSGVTAVNIHVAQNDQKGAIDFYRSKVLPHFAKRAI